MKALRQSSLLFLLAGSLITTRAFADEPEDGPPRRSRAQALFDEGRDLVFAKRFDEACPKLAESLRLENGIGTMLYLADCYEKNGQLAGAWSQFRAAASLAEEKHDERAAVARRRAASLEQKLTRLVIVVPRDRLVPGLEVTRDGMPVNEADFGGPLPVDPGIHTIAAKAPQHAPWSINVAVPASPGAITVNIPLLEARAPEPEALAPAPKPPPPAPVSTEPQSAPPAPSPEPVASHGSSWMRVTGVTLGVVGLAAAGAGAFFGLRAKGQYDDSNQNGHCTADNRCDAEGKQLRSDANGSAQQSTILVTAGLGAIATGVAFYLLSPSAHAPAGQRPPRHDVAIRPSLAPNQAGLSFTRAW